MEKEKTIEMQRNVEAMSFLDFVNTMATFSSLHLQGEFPGIDFIMMSFSRYDITDREIPFVCVDIMARKRDGQGKGDYFHVLKSATASEDDILATYCNVRAFIDEHSNI